MMCKMWLKRRIKEKQRKALQTIAWKMCVCLLLLLSCVLPPSWMFRMFVNDVSRDHLPPLLSLFFDSFVTPFPFPKRAGNGPFCRENIRLSLFSSSCILLRWAVLSKDISIGKPFSEGTHVRSPCFLWQWCRNYVKLTGLIIESIANAIFVHFCGRFLVAFLPVGDVFSNWTIRYDSKRM